MDNERLVMNESKFIPLLIAYLIVVFIFSAIPDWNNIFFIINFFVSVFFLTRTYIARLTMTDSKRYFSISGYGFVFFLSFVCPQFLIRILWELGIHLWIFIVIIWPILFLYFHLMKIDIGIIFKNPLKTRGGIISYILLMIAMILVPIMIISTAISQFEGLFFLDYLKFIIGGIILYIASIICLGILPLFLKKSKE